MSLSEADSDYITYARDVHGQVTYYWLRAPVGDDTVNAVNGWTGDGLHEGNHTLLPNMETTSNLGARVAFNLNQSSILFTAAAKDGKASTAALNDGEAIPKNADYTVSDDEKYEYKLTMKDTSRKFAVEEATESDATAHGDRGDTVTFHYSKRKRAVMNTFPQ